MFRDLETKRLKLKNIGYDDSEFMYKHFSADEVNTYLYDAEPISSVDEANKWIDFYTEEEPRNQHRWIIILKENEEKIGTCGFHRWNRMSSTVEIGYDLQPMYWRKEYISEALEAILVFAKDDMKVKKVYAHISENNTASQKTANKFGFVNTNETYYEEFHGKRYLHNIYVLNL